MNNIKLNFLERLFKYGFVMPAPLVLAFCVLGALFGKASAQEFKQVHPGVEHAQVSHKIGEDPVKISLLRLDLKKVRLDVHHALDKAIGLETTSSIAIRKGAVAAINAGFFRLDRSEFAGDPAGILVIDGSVLSESQSNRIAFRILNSNTRTQGLFDHISTETSLSVDSTRVRLSGINRQRRADEIVGYTPDFGASTLTDSLGTELVFRSCTVRSWCQIAVNERSGNSLIPKDGFVVSIGPNHSDGAVGLIDHIKRKQDPFSGQSRIISEFTGRPQFQIGPDEDVTNGVPQLIKDGKIDITWEEEKASLAFVFNRHPRTAVAKLKDGKFLMITVDGRQPGVSVGMTLQELAEYLLSLGAVDAMNLDGGGSTTMVLDGKVVNKPSDPTGERKVGDAIVVTLRKSSRPASHKN